MTIDKNKLLKVLDVYEVPHYVMRYLLQCDIKYAIQYLIYFALAKFDNTKELDEKKVNFCTFIIDNIINDNFKIFNSDKKNVTFGTGKNKYVLSLPSECNITDNFNKTIYQSVYKILFDQEISMFKYDVCYTIMLPVMLMLNIKLERNIMNMSSSDETIIQYCIKYLVKKYVKKMCIPMQMKDAIECFLHATLLAYKLPDIINDNKVLIYTNTHIVHFTKIDNYLVNVEFEHFIEILHLQEPILVFYEDDSHSKFMKAFLLLFSKQWDKHKNPDHTMVYGTENILKQLKNKI